MTVLLSYLVFLRYACTVCFHRPVFDTLDMLTVHRTGKKHIASKSALRAQLLRKLQILGSWGQCRRKEESSLTLRAQGRLVVLVVRRAVLSPT